MSMTKDVFLLPHQYELLSDTETKILGMVSGYGAGKTYAACRKAIQLSMLNPGFTGICTEPTYPMLRDIFVPEMRIALEEWNIPYKFNASNSIFTLFINRIETKILCMSAENVERLVGVNAAWAIMDEFDTSKTEVAIKAYQKLLGRLRAGNVRQLVITTTPEGFRAAHQLFVKEADDSKRLIKAKTTDNKYLPEDFIETLRQQYPENLLEAYINGNFVNLTSGSVYPYFDRVKHDSKVVQENTEMLYVGQDFNVGGSCSRVHVIRDNVVIQVDEFVSKDTYEIVENLRLRYKNNHIIMFPDASGSKGSTNSTKSDLAILREAGIQIDVGPSNPRIRDRVNAFNAMLSQNRYLINTERCPRSTEAMEQQAYDSNGDPEKFSGAATVDDWNDSGGYFIVRKFPLHKPKASVQQFKVV